MIELPNRGQFSEAAKAPETGELIRGRYHNDRRDTHAVAKSPVDFETRATVVRYTKPPKHFAKIVLGCVSPPNDTS